jgi:uncharacterized surface protein with fasciclin (FAS1) repeats
MKLKTSAAAGFAAVLLLAGCSSSSDESSSDSAASTPTASASEKMSPSAKASAAASAKSSAAASAKSSASAKASAAASEAGTVVEVASGNDDFSTLVAAVKAAGLAETLSGDGPFTVFAPTNDAFEALPKGVLDSLLKPENKDALTKILTYHVLKGKVTSDKVKAGDVDTVEGSKVVIKTDDGVAVGSAKVVTPDVEASNGVIHVIDEVLIPESVDPGELE